MASLQLLSTYVKPNSAVGQYTTASHRYLPSKIERDLQSSAIRIHIHWLQGIRIPDTDPGFRRWWIQQITVAKIDFFFTKLQFIFSMASMKEFQALWEASSFPGIKDKISSFPLLVDNFCLPEHYFSPYRISLSYKISTTSMQVTVCYYGDPVPDPTRSWTFQIRRTVTKSFLISYRSRSFLLNGKQAIPVINISWKPLAFMRQWNFFFPQYLSLGCGLRYRTWIQISTYSQSIKIRRQPYNYKQCCGSGIYPGSRIRIKKWSI